MKRTTLSLLVAGLAAGLPAAHAQMQVTGSVTPGFIASEFKGENRFRFDEYRDMRTGATFGLNVRGDSQTHYLQVFGENIGRDDQFIELKGAEYGVYKYSLYNNNIIHNLTSNAKTPFNVPNQASLSFTGTGGTAAGQALNVAGGAPTNAFLNNVNNWNRFDYGIKHENYGGLFELQSSASSPFYVRFTGNQKNTTGLRPIGQAGSSPGGPSFEMPAVVDYTTTDAAVEAGYATKTSQYTAVASWSRFNDHNNFMRWRNPLINNATNVETATTAADSDLWKIAGNAMWKSLPMGSTLALRGTYSKTTSGLPLATQGLDVSGANAGQIVNFNNNQANFSGSNSNTSFSASLTSALAQSLDSRVYYNYTDRKNNSTQIVSTPINTVTAASSQACDSNPVTGAALTTCSNELFHYRKNNAGFDLNYRINPDNKLSGGWDYTNTERERIDYNKTTDNKFYAEWKNSSFETVTGKIKYQYLDRDSNNQLRSLNPVVGPPNSGVNNFYEFYQSRFDLAGDKQNLLKFVLDATPIPFLDLGAELRFKDNKYKDVTFGRKKDSRDELYLTAGYGDARSFRVTSFFDYETSHYDSAHYVGTPPNGTTTPVSINTSTYYYDAKVKDKNWVFGVAADWIPADQWKIKAAYIWQKTNGSVDQFPGIAGVVFTNISNYDSFRRNTFNLNGTYVATKNWDVNLGYSYESYKYSDAQMDNYSYVPLNAANTSVLSVLSGAYAKPTYNANVFYGYLKYRFD